MNDLDRFVRLWPQGMEDFARRIGVTTTQLRNMRRGRSIPNRRHMQAIIALTKGEVMPNSFFTPYSPGEPDHK